MRRATNRRRRLETCTLEHVADLDRLDEAARKAAKGVMWKSTTQHWMLERYRNCLHERRGLLDGTLKPPKYKEFTIVERGKPRHIKAAPFAHRVIQKSLALNALTPAIEPTLTPGCSANRRGMGTGYAVRRMKRQLAAYARRHGRDGWILLTDFSDYFGSLPHDGVMRMAEKRLDDPRVIGLVRREVESDGARGLGLGSEPNQILAVAYPTPLDRLALNTPDVACSGRYMDDSYFISPDKEVLERFLSDATILCSRLGLAFNPRKTRIVRLSHGFTWLKKRFDITSTGRVLVRPCGKAKRRQRQRIRRQARLVREGHMSRTEAWRAWQSMRGVYFGLDAHRTLLEFDRFYKQQYEQQEGNNHERRNHQRDSRRAG